MVDKIIEYISLFLALLLVLPVHEFAHALSAHLCGDDTAKFNGRLTLNPFAHFDILGLLCFVFAGFGWAKPVPINPNNFKRYKRDSFFVSFSGVLANYILAFIFYPLFILCLIYVPDFYYFDDVLYLSIYYVYSLSLVFFVFNLIPVYPLDGFRIVDIFNKKHGPIYRFLRTKGYIVLLVLMALSVISDYLDIPQIDILGICINFLTGYLSIPITSFWGLIF